MANYYDILQIPRDATIAQIKAAFRRLARRYHPDLNPGDPEAAEKFREIERAYEILRDPARRERYDRDLEPIPSESPTNDRGAAFFYEKGLRYAREREYRRAIENYSQAIEIDPTFWKAYLQRAIANYDNSHERAVFEDCRQVLLLNPDCGEAYYYLGLARQRLGYTQSSIDAYTRAIKLDPHPARIYYQRGLAREELSEYPEALQDWRSAAEGYRVAGDFRHYRFLQTKIKTLQKNTKNTLKKKERTVSQIFKNLWFALSNIVKIFLSSLVNPRGGLSSAFLKLDKNRALEIGIISGTIGSICLAVSWRNWSVNLPFERLWFLAILPVLLIVFSSYFLRKMEKKYGHIAGDVFAGGFSFLPISLVFFLNSKVSFSEDIVGFTVGMASVYCGWIGYNAYTGISNIRPRIALVFIPFVMFFIGAFIWSVYYYL
ncbi:DnaJ domain-containing protein [Pannus brasiliensis CCIBt3594]|uniref:DnaJ domain-containing protein n=1 Tax=Pannus brasiliensis CCIBt3594 TaxID=1427578 RepID=A0AAW9QNV9_9CHRO